MIGLDNGRMISQNIWALFAPSIIAASSMLLEIVSKNPLEMKKPIPEPAEYRITSAQNEPCKWNKSFMTQYMIIMDKNPGNIPRTRFNFIRTSLPLKRNLDIE